MTLCTLFDSNYLDKGLALYYSLCKATKNFKLYIFAFDKMAERVLKDLRLRKAVIVSYEEIEDDTLRRLKQERTRAEFCWTCTSIIIEYVLKQYNENDCTYIDADMYFFGNPNILYKEILDSGCSVGIAPHRFKRDATYYENIRKNGKYCVHFNTFFNNEQGLMVLNEWKEQCIECCSEIAKDGKLGDQKYLESWPKKYSSIHELQHLGGGVAPWNINNFVDIKVDNGKVWLLDENGRYNQLIFYHFEAMKYLPNDYVYLNIWNNSKSFSIKNIKIKKNIYIPYLKVIDRIRDMLWKKYSICFNHMILEEERAKVYLPNIRDGICEWNYKRMNVWKRSR